MPSGSNFWESNRGKGFIIGGTGFCGGSQALRNMQETRHQRMMRSSERVTRLTEGKMNPAQYVLDTSRDDVPSSLIKQDLVAWGKTWKGTNFSKPEVFDVTDEWGVSSNLARKVMGLKNRSCYLKACPPDKGVESQSELSSFDARLSPVPTTR